MCISSRGMGVDRLEKPLISNAWVLTVDIPYKAGISLPKVTIACWHHTAARRAAPMDSGVGMQELTFIKALSCSTQILSPP